MIDDDADRKLYLINIISNFFCLDLAESCIGNIRDDECFEKFLNDPSCSLFSVSASNGSLVSSNEVPSAEFSASSRRRIIFLKENITLVTPENVKSAVLVFAQDGSLVSSLYYALKSFYIPVLLSCFEGKEPQLQKILMDLESRLRFASCRIPEDKDYSVITSVLEEIDYWKVAANSSAGAKAKDEAKEFVAVLANVEHDFINMKNAQTVDLDAIIDDTIAMLDDLWCANSYSYPQKRMQKLMDVIGNSIVFYLQQRLEKFAIWTDDFNVISDFIDCGISACLKWNKAINQLCTVDWSGSSCRSWENNPPAHELCSAFATRLVEIKSLRSAHRQLTKLLSSSEKKEMEIDSSFSYFNGLKPGICSIYTESQWKSAVSIFEKSLNPAEKRVSIKLKSQLRHLKANTLQLLQEFRRYKELIKRPTILSNLTAERENLLALLQQYIDKIDIYDGPANSLLEMPLVVGRIYRVRELKSRIQDVMEVNSELLHDLSGCAGLEEACKSLYDQLAKVENEHFEQWIKGINEKINNQELTLSTESKVLRLNKNKMTEVNYDPALFRLIREIQQLSIMGLHIPVKIRELSERAMKFANQAMSLEQIANFHNNVGDRIISSQRPMLLPVAQELDRLINMQQGVTWSDAEAVDKYIVKLREIVERLSKECNKLAFYHNQIRIKVVHLMDDDIIRQNNAWKQGLRDIKEIISHVENLKFPHMESWKLHWDYQLYKALERQYQLRLCNLHSHFPEFKMELIYRQQKLQFHPPIEEIRLKYYSQVKKFLSIPSSFRGVSDGATPLFATIIPRNASRFGGVFIESENLFQQLEKVRQKWSKWVSLGSVNLDELIEANLKEADDWDQNFRASKTLAQEIAKLQCNDERVGCINVSVLPIRGEMELHNRRYWDALVTSLQCSILRDIAHFENYIAEASQVLTSRPKTISQIGEAHIKYARLMDDSSKMLKELESIARKNKVLANWTKERIEQVNKIFSQWDNFQSNLINYQSLIGRQVGEMKVALQGEIDNLILELEKFEIRWNQLKPKETDIQDASADALNKNLILINEKSEEWCELNSRKERLLEDCGRFDLPKPDFRLFEKIEAELSRCKVIWTFYEEFHSDLSNFAKEEWIFFRNKLYRLDEFLTSWEKKVEERETSALTVRMLQEINDYKALIPALKYVRGEMFSDKHWLEMFSFLEMTNKAPEILTLGDFLSVKSKIISSEEQLQELNNRAASEISIRQALNELEAWEVQARFTLAQHTDSKNNMLKLIKNFAEVLNKIGDNQCLLQSILNSPNSKNFLDRAGIWETKLTNLDASVRNLNLVQRKWVYLEPIFQNGNFAVEQGRFERVDQDFRHIMSEVCKDNHVIALTRIVNLSQTLNLLVDQLARCQNSLNEYLQEKRTSFPRFYFLGDDDLLELLGQSTKERVIQTHVKKIFSGVNSVVMENGIVTSVKSLHGETVDLLSPVQVTAKIEEWLDNLNNEIKKTLKTYVYEYEAKYASGDADLTKLPSQVLCLGESLRFTAKCEEHITNGRIQEFYKLLKAKLDSDARTSLDWSNADDVMEIKLKALILEEIHHMKVVETLLENNVTSVSDWHWQKQLRYYMSSERQVIVRMLDAELEYSYEYQGDNPKLVRTELTEKCFLTLTQAMHMGLGGNPFGPAGTGKTESVKALGALLGRQVLVFNCDEGIDIKSMARIFVGLIKCGAWGCFDEFNRLEETTLSAVSMLIQPIQTSLRGKRKTVMILDKEVEMNKNCGIFVTLNPAGKEYGGRQKLPDNLKQLFRPVIMSTPDREEIAQVGLYCEGYKDAKAIGRKLVEVFNLAKCLLSKRQHYDWGLRALKTVLWSCGNLFKEAHKVKKLEQVSEMEMAVEALRFNTLSKLTFSDSILFDQIVRDVFPEVKFIKFDSQDLTHALKSSAGDLGLQISDYQIKKCIELYEQMQQRMGVALIGPSGSGKTTIIKLLKHGLEKMGRNVKFHIMNPKSMPRTQLLGHIDLDTRQWTEGVLTSNALKLHAAASDVWSWLICDGDVDPDWVEALNSVLDDNRLLTLPSGWRIQFGPNVNFLFETCNLHYASPATVSRMGIIYFSDESVDVSLTINSWLKLQDEESRQFLEPYMSDYFYASLEWIKKNGSLAVPFSVLGLVNNGLSHLIGVKCKPHFVVSLIYGLGANLTYESRKIFAQYVFESTGEFVQDPSKILDSYFNRKRERIDVFPMEEGNCNVKEEFPPIMTPSSKTSLAILEPWVKSHQPILISGSEGCGKNLLLKSCLSKLPATEVATIHCSTLISPFHVVQKLKQICMVRSSSTGRVLRPKNCQKIILYFKNLEFAAPDKWGTNMLMAWLQQVIAYNGFYDTDLEWTNFEGIQIIATLSSGGSIPNERLTSLMRVYFHNPPDEHDLKLIYSHYVKSIVEDHFGRYKALSTPSRISSLVSTLVITYQEVRKSFSQVTHKSYCFSPRCLTQWCSGLRRYSIDAGNPVKSFLTAVAYEALRLFYDRLTTAEDRRKMKNILTNVIDSEWNQNEIVQCAEDLFFVTDGDRKMLTGLNSKDWSQVVRKGIQMSLGNESDIIVIDELLRLTSCIDRSLSVPKKSLTLCGKCGVGRKTALKIVSSLHGSRLITINMSHEYGLKNLKMDLKAAFQVAGVEGEPAYLVVEGYQIINDTFMDMISSLLCYGEVPGLYAPEELESIISQLKSSSPMDSFSGTAASYFAQRMLENLHVVLLLDFDESYFPLLCESCPRIFTKCEVVWNGDWSPSTMKIIPRALFSGISDASDLISTDSNISSILADIHNKFKGKSATPRRYISFVQFYIALYILKRKANLERTNCLTTGVKKLTETRAVVDNLKTEANRQEAKLAEKQTKAASALDLIGETMKNANIHKGKMEKLKEKITSENKTLMERKKAIDKELAEVEPLIAEARQAVGNIKNESLSEIRSLRAPPDVIRDILEGVLRLMGIQDTSWNSMKTFLAKRGIKEEIRTFDANRISAENKEAVENLLNTRRDSFDPKIAKRASVAAAPLAAWVKANITYAKVLEKILPLEKEQINLEENLKSTEGQMHKLSTGLGEVDKKVAELKEQLTTYTREAAVIEINLAKAKETMISAQELVSKLDDEYNRWRSQLTELSEELTELPKKVLIASAFITYLASSSEEVRESTLAEWEKEFNVFNFSLTDFVSSDRDKMKWASEGLCFDGFSTENATIILETHLPPLLIDPDGMGLEWLKKHLEDQHLDVISQSNARFQSNLELAVRFGKNLIIEEVDEVSPVLMPILRKNITIQGPRQTVYVGEKIVDYHKNFKVFLVTRRSDFNVPADVLPISFATTRKGLARQLLSLAVEHERPELGRRRNEILKGQEQMKSKLFSLQEMLLKELSSAQGDILQNTDLLLSLNQTKTSSEDVSKALSESKAVGMELDKECEAFKPISEFFSDLYFTVASLSKMSVMTSYSVHAFRKLFLKSLKSFSELESNFESQKLKMIKLVYNYVSRSLFKADRLTFAIHLVQQTFSECIQPKEWKVFTGEAIAELDSGFTERETLPAWVEEDRIFDINMLRNALPQLFDMLKLSESEEWIKFAKSGHCENEFPKHLPEKLSNFQLLLVVQAFRPDRLLSYMTKFCLKVLHLETLSPSSIRLFQIFEESVSTEPILLIVSPGADPSKELTLLSKTTRNMDLREVALGQGQISVALEALKSCAETGQWLCLKNLHLMTSWLRELEKELRTLKPNENFRLWLTTESHSKFSPVLANNSLKVVYEIPAGIKKNLQRTYGSWTSEMFRRRGILFARTMFAAAWFHAVIQERRSYIPQGWTKFYEITDADLLATSDLISRISQSGITNWNFLHGVLLDAIYGNRVESEFDRRVLAAYVREFFNDATLSQGREFGPSLTLPSSESYPEYLELIHHLADFDKPSYFGLPENIERSWQKIKSSQVIDQIKVLHQPGRINNFDVKSWQKHLSPILSLWKKLQEGVGLLEGKHSEQTSQNNLENPLYEFFREDFRCGLKTIQLIHKTLTLINKVMRGIILPDQEIINISRALLSHQTPGEWQNCWEGPENPMKFMRAVTYKTCASLKLQKKQLGETFLQYDIDLSELLQPEMFLKAVKQLSGRRLNVPLDELEQVCDWKDSLKNCQVSLRIKNLQLEGAVFNGHAFAHTSVESPSTTTAPTVHLAFVKKGSLDLHGRNGKKIVFPVYQTSERIKAIITLAVPCEGSHDDWFKAAPAFFLRESDN